MPKEAGVRPIANLGRRLPGKRSINQILQAAFQILTYEKVIASFYFRNFCE